jgi:hypothetical protein
VSYRRLVNWGRKFCLDDRRQNYLSVFLQPMRAMLPPVAWSRVRFGSVLQLRRGF